jgi:hypothetical protein
MLTSTAAGTGYAEDRSAIEDLQARCLSALDFKDPDRWVADKGIPPGNRRLTDVIAVRASGPPLDGLPAILVY